MEDKLESIRGNHAIVYIYKKETMNSTVTYYNNSRGMFVVLLENGEYSVIELLDSNEINIGDEIAGELDVVGSTDLENLTTGDTFSVIIQNVHCNQQQALNRTALR